MLFAFGLASYALSLQLFRRFLHRNVAPRLVAPTILFVHALCVLAMYLGRVIRLNSWDVVTAPQLRRGVGAARAAPDDGRGAGR